MPSVAKCKAWPGQASADSDLDLDLAVLVDTYADAQTLWALSGELADRAGCALDLLDLRAASTVMQHQVLLTGQRLWAANAEQAGVYESYVLSAKTALDEARARLLGDIAKEGRVYGR